MHYDIETGIKGQNGLFSKKAIAILLVFAIAALLYLIFSGEIEIFLPYISI
jgi:hypothetical protein